MPMITTITPVIIICRLSNPDTPSNGDQSKLPTTPEIKPEAATKRETAIVALCLANVSNQVLGGRRGLRTIDLCFQVRDISLDIIEVNLNASHATAFDIPTGGEADG